MGKLQLLLLFILLASCQAGPRFDCFPEPNGANQGSCEARGCIWKQDNSGVMSSMIFFRHSKIFLKFFSTKKLLCTSSSAIKNLFQSQKKSNNDKFNNLKICKFQQNAPWCYFKDGVGYKLDSQQGSSTYNLRKNSGPTNPWGGDFTEIKLTTKMVGSVLNVKIGVDGR